jgi:hypothetical protein
MAEHVPNRTRGAVAKSLSESALPVNGVNTENGAFTTSSFNED